MRQGFAQKAKRLGADDPRPASGGAEKVGYLRNCDGDTPNLFLNT